MLLGGQSGTVTLSDSLARMGAARAAGAPASAKMPPPPLTAADLPPAQAAEFNAWLATRAAPPPPPPSLAPAPAPAPAAPPATPVATAYPPLSPTPSTPSYAEIRNSVAALTPTSPIATVRATEASLKLGVKMNLGGSTHRTTRTIVDEMRACVGLAPWYAPPLGLPVKPAATVPPPAPAAAAPQFAACVRADCPCTASYNGLAG